MTDPKPPRRFTELSDAQRKFIGKLDADDIATLKRVIKLFGMLQGWCRINRWIAFTLIAALFLAVQFFDATFKLIASFGAPK
jgi:hypothetical protein